MLGVFTRIVKRVAGRLRGMMTHAGVPVNFGAITMPLLTIEGGNDNMCSLGQTEAAHTFCPNIPDDSRGRYVQHNVGHYGVFSGSKFQNEIYPAVRAFIRDNDSSGAGIRQ